MAERVDLVVIGMGPGGEEVAERCAEAGMSVVGVETNLVGGECPYWGCIPSKMIIRAADALAEARRVPLLAGTATVGPDWSPVARRLRDATDSWDDRVAVERFEKLGGRFVRGEGRLDGVGRVVVGESAFEASRGVVLATGMVPVIPPIDGLDKVQYWTNRQAAVPRELPARLVVLGGGAIGVELAQALARFGVRVAVVEPAERVISMEEPEASAVLEEVFAREGVSVHCGSRAVSVEYDGNSFAIGLQGGTVDVVRGEKLLVATGRRAALTSLGLDSVGLDPTARAITVDPRLRAGSRLWAVGDCTGHGAFTHVAIYQARIAIADILQRPHAEADYHALPRATFTDPEVGAVGLTEQQARAAGIDVRVGVSPMSASIRGWIHGPGNDGLFKLVEDARTGVLVGATVMGPGGGELLGMLAVAVHARVPVQTLRDMIWAYPTLHRGIEGALAALPAR